MNKKERNNFTYNTKNALYRAGEIAVKEQGEVENIGKEASALVLDNIYTKQRRSAKTVVDEKIQEILLAAAAETLDANKVYVDAEESTPLKKIFAKHPTSTTLIIDPIDGTLDYISGKNNYCVSVGIIKDGVILTSLVYFPVQKKLYFIENECAYCEQQGKLYKLSAPKTKNDNKIYVNNRIGYKIIKSLLGKGFVVVDDAEGIISWRNALMQCIEGKYNACIFHSPQIRDVLLGAIISMISDGYSLDWNGNKTVWPQAGRISSCMFGFKPVSKTVLSCLVQ